MNSPADAFNPFLSNALAGNDTNRIDRFNQIRWEISMKVCSSMFTEFGWLVHLQACDELFIQTGNFLPSSSRSLFFTLRHPISWNCLPVKSDGPWTNSFFGLVINEPPERIASRLRPSCGPERNDSLRSFPIKVLWQILLKDFIGKHTTEFVFNGRWEQGLWGINQQNCMTLHASRLIHLWLKGSINLAGQIKRLDSLGTSRSYGNSSKSIKLNKPIKCWKLEIKTSISKARINKPIKSKSDKFIDYSCKVQLFESKGLV